MSMQNAKSHIHSRQESYETRSSFISRHNSIYDFVFMHGLRLNQRTPYVT